MSWYRARLRRAATCWKKGETDAELLSRALFLPESQIRERDREIPP